MLNTIISLVNKTLENYTIPFILSENNATNKVHCERVKVTSYSFIYMHQKSKNTGKNPLHSSAD